MAINVDQVYKTVLLIINKEQRGYLTPNEFNKLAIQVQLDILDTYFDTLNQQLRVPQNESEYGNRYKTVQERLDVFKTIGDCAFTAATAIKKAFFTPPTSSGVASGTQLLSATTLQIAYPLTTVTQSQVEESTVVVTYLGAAYADYNITGGVFNLTNGSLPTGTPNDIVITLYPQDFYKLGTVLYRDDRAVEPIQRNELALLNMSPISKPSDYFPVYLYDNKEITIHPQTINDRVQATYIRKPADPTWNFSSSAGYYVWDPATSVNFELDITEQTNVIIQILLYAGIVIKDQTIVQAAASEIAQEQQNERN
tara:strand:+ start:864 stop:1796 length:933 start_codon:yes stop_codon:yes gene_type:complete